MEARFMPCLSSIIIIIFVTRRAVHNVHLVLLLVNSLAWSKSFIYMRQYTTVVQSPTV